MIIVESLTSEKGLEYDQRYLDSMPAIQVIEALGLTVAQAQEALQDLDVNKYSATAVLTRLAAHLMMQSRRVPLVSKTQV